MKQRMLRVGCAGLLALGLVGLAPVAAQTVVVPSGRVRVVPPDAVLALLRSNGFSPLERPIRRGVTYALRAVDADGEKVRVIVDARAGTILAVTPLEPQPLAPGPGIASVPMAPGPNVRRMPDGPSPDDDATPGPAPRIYRPAGPPVVYQSDPPVVHGPRPLSPLPPSAVARPAGEPPDARIVTPEPGMLPPPPERFPQRVAPTSELKRKAPPPRRAASAALPKSPPLPRPKPETPVGLKPSAAAPAPASAAAPPPAAPAASAPAAPPSADALPH